MVSEEIPSSNQKYSEKSSKIRFTNIKGNQGNQWFRREILSSNQKYSEKSSKIRIFQKVQNFCYSILVVPLKKRPCADPRALTRRASMRLEKVVFFFLQITKSEPTSWSSAELQMYNALGEFND